jgi:hypothetical protein
MLTHDGSQSGAGRVPCDYDARRIDTQLARVLPDPCTRKVAVLHSRGELMLGRKHIVDRNDAAATRIRKHPAQSVVRLNAAEDASAAVKIDDAEGFLLVCDCNRCVDADR